MFRAQVQSAMLNVETALFERIATFIEIVNVVSMHYIHEV